MFKWLWALVPGVITSALLGGLFSADQEGSVAASTISGEQCTQAAIDSSPNPNKIRFISCGGFL